METVRGDQCMIMQRRRAALLAALLPFVAATPALADNERSYDLPPFDRIDVSAGIKVIAAAGAPQSVVVKAVNGDFKDIEIEVKDGELSISREWNRLRWHGKRTQYKVTVSADTLRGISASSGSHAMLSNIDANAFLIDMSSGAHAEVAGESSVCALDLSSGANLDAGKLFCDVAEIDVSSGGHGVVYVRDAVEGDASSGGHVTVYGSPTKVKLDRSSGGRIIIKTEAQAKRR